MAKRLKGAFFAFSVLVVIGAQVMLAYAIFSNNLGLLERLSLFFGAVFPVLALSLEWLRHQNLQVFLWTNRLLSRFSRFAPAWRLNAMFSGELSEKVLEEIREQFVHLRTRDWEVAFRYRHEHEFEAEILRGPTVTVTYHPSRPGTVAELGENTAASIGIVIRNYNVGYLQAERAIREKIAPVLEAVSSAMPTGAESHYSLTISYEKGKNPFYGLYIAQLPPNVVSQFSIRLDVGGSGGRNVVRISETAVSINTRSSSALGNLALDFLSFKPRLQEHFIGG